MWFSFLRPKDRLSLEELRYQTDQLQKVQVVDENNKDDLIEALRSISELVIYGDQHDPNFFEFFMEKQIMGEFVHILKISRTMSIALQLLQTMSIMIQNLASEHAIYYIFSNEHINSLISYSFDFRNEELLSYYISFLRAISGKLNNNTISLLVKTANDEIISFPLYTEAIRYAFHQENMIRIAVRALTLNIYHVADENVNKFISRSPVSDYFSKLVLNFTKKCLNLDQCVTEITKNSDSSACILTAVDDIEDNLYYFSDVISAGVPELGRLITDNMLELLIFPLLLPSLKEHHDDSKVSASSSLYLLCCILRIVKTKDLASSIATTLFCSQEYFIPKSEVKPNGCTSNLDAEYKYIDYSIDINGSKKTEMKYSNSSSILSLACSSIQRCKASQISLREVLLYYIVCGNEPEAFGSLSLLSTLLQSKELDESMLDGLGILPRRKQHKKLLLQALVGEGSDEEQLFSSEKNSKECVNTELDRYLQKFKAQYGSLFCCGESGVSPHYHRHQVLDALMRLFCRSNVSAEVLWAGGWLLRQLLPHSEAQINSNHMKLLKESHEDSISVLFDEIKGSWCDILITVLVEEWKNCKKAIEASSPQKDPNRTLFSYHRCFIKDESFLAAGERMCDKLKIFVLRYQLLIFTSGGTLPDLAHHSSLVISHINPRAKVAGLDVLVPKSGTEIKLDDAVPCKIAFERGKERHFSFLAISRGTSGWIILAEEYTDRPKYGIIRVAAPLGGSSPKIDDKHPKWLHLRIRPSTLPSTLDIRKFQSIGKTKAKTKMLVDGRWTLAFYDDEMCKSAESMVLQEIHLLCSEVEARARSLLNLN
ncbi:hypothetical protein ZOSMA_474G00130 [Zostera marina]|uniref:FPL domain-containing protein n=1 Tax=Zostera marina TaxID=29655 RepID=A0A0K9NZT2_ZOSMR|nr:hypothetical protein ZOSMA_474G00130 [Zostera marina]